MKKQVKPKNKLSGKTTEISVVGHCYYSILLSVQEMYPEDRNFWK